MVLTCAKDFFVVAHDPLCCTSYCLHVKMFSFISYFPHTDFIILLCSKDVANFHRPKALWYPHDNEVAVKEQGKLPNQGPMKIIIKSLGGKGSKLHVDADETISSVKAKASKKLGCHLSLDVLPCYVLGYF